MSIAELARGCFHSGVSPQRWTELCQLLKERTSASSSDFESDLSNSVLSLFNAYPAEPLLLAYIRCSISTGLLSLSSFLVAFLQAAKSPLLHDASTLDAICNLVKEEHYASDLPALGGLISYEQSTSTILMIVQSALNLFRIAHAVPSPSFQPLTSSVTSLVMSLLSCVGDLSQVSTTQAMILFADILDMLQTLRITGDIRTVLEHFAVSLGALLGDDARLAQEAQMMQTLQLALDKGNSVTPHSDSDIVICSLVLRHLVTFRATLFGSGNTSLAVAMLVATFRGTSWSPATFYTQLFLAAITCLSQGSTQPRYSLLWKSFIITRLPQLLLVFEHVLGSEAVSHAEWRSATQAAMAALLTRSDILTQCDMSTARVNGGEMSQELDGGNKIVNNKEPPFFSYLLQHYSSQTHLLDSTFVLGMEPSLSKAVLSQMIVEARESGLDVESYIESRLAPDNNGDEAQDFLQRALEDYASHPVFSLVFSKRFISLCQALDVDGFSHICRLLYLHPSALDVISLHLKLADIVTYALVFVEDYDCESVGDPQTAVSRLGEIILFIQSTLVRYKLSKNHLNWNGRVLRPGYLLSTSTVYAVPEISGDDAAAFGAWFKALFDSGSEGIDDNILRATKPKTLLKLSASLISYAIGLCAEKHMDSDVLNNGVSYFTGPLLSWTLAGVIKALYEQILQNNFSSNVHLTILQTLVQSPSCPLPVLQLTAHGILRLASDQRAQHVGQNINFNPVALRAIANRALGISGDAMESTSSPSLSLNTQVSWLDQPRRSIRDVIAAARAGKAAWLDVDRCVAAIGPTKFLQVLWQEISASAPLGDMESCRRIVVFALASPSSITNRYPPLLPIFFHYVIMALLPGMDQQVPPEQTIIVELLTSVIASSLTTVLHLEWALRVMESESRYPLGQPCASSARKLARDLKHSDTSTAKMILQRLSSSTAFVANFPMLMI